MDVSIIVVNYNTKEITLECINSIFKHTQNIQFEVILVDNASTDGSGEIFANNKRLIYIQNEQNIGFGRANNIGYKQSKGEYIFLLNSDTIIQNNAIELFFRNAQHEVKNVACWGCMLMDKHLHTATSYGKFTGVKEEILQEIWFNPLSLFFNKTKKVEKLKAPLTFPSIVDNISGADLFIRREVIEKLGLFNPAYFMYMEEVDLQRRYAKNGYTIKIIDGPLIIHLEGKSINNNSTHTLRKSIISLESKLIYYKEWSSKINYFIYRLILIIARTPFLILSKYSYKEKRKYWKTITKSYKK